MGLKVKIATSLAVVALLVGCRGTREVVTPTAPVAGKAWQTMQAGGALTVGSDKKDFTSSMQLRMVAGRQIVISLRPMLGIEMGKMIIASDSILMIDKWHKQYLLEPVSTITGGMPVTVDNLQDVFTGREFAAAGELARYFVCAFKRDSAGHITSMEINALPDSGLPDGRYEVKYDDIADEGGIDGLPHRVTATASLAEGKQLSMSLKYNNVKWDKDIRIEEFTAPANYKRINAKRLMSLFGDSQ